MPETQPEPRQHCRHIHASGHRCGSPSLRAQPFCYFHHTSRRPIPQTELDRRRGHQATFAIGSLEDRTSIQLTLAEILHRIATHDLDPRRAGLLLYGLQIAASNLPNPSPSPRKPSPTSPTTKPTAPSPPKPNTIPPPAKSPSNRSSANNGAKTKKTKPPKKPPSRPPS